MEPTGNNPGDKPTDVATAQDNHTSVKASATSDEMLPCIWCPELRPKEPAQMPSGGSITSRSLVQTGFETVPRSMRQWVKERSDLQDVTLTFTTWERRSLSVSVIHGENGRRAVQLHPFYPKTLPPDVKSEYPVLHGSDHCVIIGEYPPPGIFSVRTTDCSKRHSLKHPLSHPPV
ncbi:uncharacterized protein [Dermacentor andersoni]|uniref:uncharacterized protein n=1 Tax=Dermacentor andersoni TaxID=34620 RepID=UPI003B3A6244